MIFIIKKCENKIKLTLILNKYIYIVIYLQLSYL